jgi:hypothetical protein
MLSIVNDHKTGCIKTSVLRPIGLGLAYAFLKAFKSTLILYLSTEVYLFLMGEEGVLFLYRLRALSV